MGLRTLFLFAGVCTDAVNADSGNPCDEQSGGRDVATPTFCQPREEQGSYGVRSYTMSGNEMCDRIEHHDCFTVEDMKCDGDPVFCLKWDRDAYVGRATIPSGVRLRGWGTPGWGDWNCDGQNRFSKDGPFPSGSGAFDFWDYWYRVDAFVLELQEGYKCENGAIVPDESCKPAQIIGRWTYWFSQESNDTTTRKLSIGLSNAKTIGDSSTYRVSFGEKIGGGAKVGEAAVEGGESSTSWELSSEQSLAIQDSVTQACTHTKVDEIDKTLRGKGVYWQFIMYANNTDACPAQDHTSRLYIPEYVHTPNVGLPPCCAPGNFVDADKTIGDCIKGSPRLCGHAPVPPPPSSASCSKHSACSSLKLKGNCCPTDNGVMLGCCNSHSDSTFIV